MSNHYIQSCCMAAYLLILHAFTFAPVSARNELIRERPVTSESTHPPEEIAAFPDDGFTMFSVGDYFSIRYPRGWFLVENYQHAESGVKLTVLSRVPSINDAGGIPRDMIKTDVVVRPQRVQEVVAQTNQEWDGKTIVRRQMLTLSGEEALRVWATVNQPEVEAEYNQIITIFPYSDRETIIISSLYHKRTNPGAASLIEQVHNTFRSQKPQ